MKPTCRLTLICFLVLGFSLISTAFESGTAFAQIQQCPLTIIKSASPADDTLFEFELSVNASGTFTLQDPSDNSETILIPSETAGVVITEILPRGWELSDIQCDGDPGFGFIFAIGDSTSVGASCTVPGNTPPEGRCVFINTLVQGVPALSEWGLLSLAGFIGLVSFMALYRRTRTKYS